MSVEMYRVLVDPSEGNALASSRPTPKADNAEAIYEHARLGGFPADSVTMVGEQIGPDFG